MKKFYSLILLFAFLIANNLDAAAPRKVLIETSSSGNVAKAATFNPALQTWINSVRDKVVPVTFHANINAPDEFYNFNTETGERVFDYYGRDNYQFQADYPMVFVAGKEVRTPSGNRTVGDVTAAYDLEKGKLSPVKITVVQDLSFPKKAQVTAVVETSEDLPVNTRLFVCSVEKHITKSIGNNGETEFYWIARHIQPSNNFGQVVSLKKGEKKGYTFTFDILDPINPKELYFNAWVQDYNTNYVYQAEELSDHSSDPSEIKVKEAPIKFTETNFDTTFTVNVFNNSLANIQIDSIALIGPDAASFKLSYNQALAKLFPANNLEVGVNFVGTNIGTYNAKLVIGTNAKNKSYIEIPISAEIKSSIAKPKISLSKENLDFGDEVKTGFTQAFKILNLGNAELDITKFEITDNEDKSYFFLFNSGDPIKLKAKESKTVYIRFNPKTADNSYYSEVHIFSNSYQSGEVVVNLSGKSYAILQDFAELYVGTDTPEINFGEVDKATKFQFITSNFGNKELSISTFAITNSKDKIFTFEKSPKKKLAPFDIDTLNLIFKPGKDTSYSESLSIASNSDPEPIYVIKLKGTGKNVSIGSISEPKFTELNDKIKAELIPNIISNSAILRFDNSELTSKIDLMIVDLNGNVILEKNNIASTTNEINLDFSQFNSGNYQIMFISSGKIGSIPCKVVK